VRRSNRIDRLVKIAEAEERKLAEVTGASQRKLREQQQRLGELNAYRNEYARGGTARSYASAAQMKDFHAFIGRLDQAVQSQKQIIRECEHRLEQHRRRWQQKRQRLESLQKVGNRFRSEESADADRRAQRIADDRSYGVRLFDDD
jgi:flagellar FliJ protein